MATARDKAVENAERYEYARDNGHLDYLRKARRCDDFFEGYENKQWDDDIVRVLKARNKPILTINKIFPTIGVVMGEQLQNQSDISFRPTASGNEDTANALDKTWVHVANSNHLDWVRAEVADNGFITSRGFYDMRIDFSDNMRGEIRIKSVNPRNVLIDPDADSYDPDGWKEVFTTKWMSPNDIALLYGKAKADEVKAKHISDRPAGFDFIDTPMDRFGDGDNLTSTIFHRDRDLRRYLRIIERQYKTIRIHPHFVDPINGDTRAVPDHWADDKIRRVVELANVSVIDKPIERIHWTVSVDDLLLFDALSPYKHFTIVPYFPYFRHGRTIGLVENLLSPQENLNKTRSQELHIVNTTSNSGWKTKRGNVLNMDPEELEQRGAETGLVLEVDDMDGTEKIAPNQVPTGLDRISFKSDNDIAEISLVSDSLRGLDRADVSGKAIEKKQIRGSVSMAKPFANLTRTDHILARNALDLMQTFYTEERILRIVLPHSVTQETEEILINHRNAVGEMVNDLTLGEYEVMTTSVPAREQHEDTQFDQALALKELGVAIPDVHLIQHSRLMHKKDIIESLNQPDPFEEETKQLELARGRAEVEKMSAESIAKKADAAVKLQQSQQNAVTPEMELKREELALKRRELDIKEEEMRRKMRIELVKAENDRIKAKQTPKTASAKS